MRCNVRAVHNPNMKSCFVRIDRTNDTRTAALLLVASASKRRFLYR